MRKIITISIISLFCLCIFSSYLIVKNKVGRNQPAYTTTRTSDIPYSEASKIIRSFDPNKNYYYKYTLLRKYYSKGMRILVKEDTLSTEIKLEDK